MKESRRKSSSQTVARLRSSPLSQTIIEKLTDIADMLPDETDWLRVKKALLLELAPADRQLFSRRDDDTRKHPPFNEFEKVIRNTWLSITGNKLIMPSDKMMADVDPDCYL